MSHHNLSPSRIYPPKISLQCLLIFPFVLQIMIAVGLVGYLSYRSGQKAVEMITEQLIDQASYRIKEHLDVFTRTTQQAIAINRRAVQEGSLNIKNPEAIRQHFWNQINLSPSLAAVSFANEQKELIGYQRILSPELLAYANKVTGKKLHLGSFFLEEIRSSNRKIRRFYLVDHQGNRQELVYSVPIDDIRTAPWYRMAVQSKQQAWSNIYVYKSQKTLGISAIAPIYDANGNRQGVLNSNNLLDGISQFLSLLKLSPSGKTFVMNQHGDLVATSILEKPYQINSQGMPIPLKAEQSQDPWIRAIINHIKNQYGSLQKIPDNLKFKIAVKGDYLFVKIIPYNDQYGLQWLLVMAIPEADFMEQINLNIQITILLCLLTLFMTTTLGVLTARWITNPIHRLIQASQAIAEGKNEQAITVKGITELESLANSFHRMQHQLKIAFETLEAEVQNRTKELTVANQKLEVISKLDGLTQIANRRCFDTFLDLEWRNHFRQQNSLGLILIDIDYFKQYNDTYGHQQGDECLIQVARTIAKTVHRSTDLAARYGGEEFAVILPNTNLAGTLTIAELIRTAISDLAIPHRTSSVNDRVTLSLGITSQIPTREVTATVLIAQADQALYMAKKQGRDRTIAQSD